ncbi:MAG: L,D-transpeptidase [Aestuariivirgaceae bacterium]|nr:L,D-transpeptidase [Aestuariivirgaceae bacterium]
MRKFFTLLLLLLPLEAHATGNLVSLPGAPPGLILIRMAERKLYLTLPGERAIQYTVAVGKIGRQWQGNSHVAFKQRNPTWHPPEMVRRDNPSLPRVIPPGPSNPLGAAVLVLGDGTYGIHGTNRPTSIGTAASYGCFRMRNEDVLDLYARVPEGTPVIVQR